MRIDPPPSLAVESGTMPEASAADDPPLDPPGVRSRFQGLRVAPNSSLSVKGMCPNSGVFVFPTTIAPAAFSRATSASSKSTRLSR